MGSITKEDERIDMELTTAGCLQMTSESGFDEPQLSATRWRAIQDTINPEEVQEVKMSFINLGQCHQDVFDFLSQCKNTTELYIYSIKDDTEDNRNIVKGLTKMMSRMNKLRCTDITGIKGADVLKALNAPDLRVLILWSTKLSGQSQSLLSCLSRLSRLSYLQMGNCGLNRKEMIRVISILPESCPNIVHLDTDYCVKLKPGDLQPLCKLSKLTSLAFSTQTVDDLLLIVKKLPPHLELIFLQCFFSLPDRLDDFKAVIKTFTMLRNLYTWTNMLDSGSRKRLTDVMERQNEWLDGKGQNSYINQLNILKEKCLSSQL